MPIHYPASLDSFTNPSPSTSMLAANHAGQHANLNDAVEALQAKVGIDSSTVTTSHDYRIVQLESLKHAHVEEHVIGSMNGINVTFTLSNTPKANTVFLLFYNGLKLFAGSGNDFTRSGTTLTMSFAPLYTDTLVALYIV